MRGTRRGSYRVILASVALSLAALCSALLLAWNAPAQTQSQPANQPQISGFTTGGKSVSLSGRAPHLRGANSSLGLGSGMLNGPAPKTAITSATTASSTTDACAGASNVTATLTTAPEIVELARSLKYDPDLIYEYVYNNIETLPIFGSLKGPLGTVLDGKGTAYDQAELMVALLNQDPNRTVPAIFQTGQIQYSASQLSNWLGVDTGVNSVVNILGNDGYPSDNNRTVIFTDSTGTVVQSVHTETVWVKVNIGGTNYLFDPSTKTYNRSTGIASLATALGYTPSTSSTPSPFITHAESGATVTAGVVNGLNRSNARSDLTGFANNLVQYIRTNNPVASTADIIGGKSILPLPLNTHQRLTALTNTGGTITDIATIPASSRTRLCLSMAGMSTPLIMNSSDIYGRRVTVSFDGSIVPTFRIDGQVQGTGTAVAANASLSMPTEVFIPTVATAAHSQNLNVTASANAVFAISNGWGDIGRGMVERHRKLLQQNTAANPSTPGAEPVLGESLVMLGHMWLAQRTRENQLVDRMAGTLTEYLFAVGISGEKVTGSVQGPFVDLPVNVLSVTQLLNRSAATATPIEDTAFISNVSFSSVLESGTIEQTQPTSTAVSTVKLLDIFGQTASAKIYDINNAAIAGDDCNNYRLNIRPILAPSYSAGDLSRIDSSVLFNPTSNSCGTPDATHPSLRVIAPATPTTVNSYKGVGFFTVAQDDSQLGAIISGGLSGGFWASSFSEPPQTFNFNTAATVFPPVQAPEVVLPAVSSGNSVLQFGSLGDPTNLVTGDYTYNHTDLTLGSSAFPYGLGITRAYDSGTRFRKSPLGNGWTHNFAITAAADSDGFEGLGVNSPINAAAVIAGNFVVQDILSTSNGQIPLDRMVLMTVVQRWMMDQITNNVVAVTQPGNSEQFVLLPDGSYNPPLGSASSLSLAAGLYTYKTKDGTKLAFDAAGNLSLWTSAAGANVTLNYNGTGASETLNTVSDGLGHTLTMHYTGALLSSVTDGNSRSVSYAYDSSNNLTTFTDAGGNATTYVYDQPGRMTQLFYPSFPTVAFVTNTYDSLSRIKTQANANNASGFNTTYNYFFAGSRTEEDDPLGFAHVIYNSPRGKTLFDIDKLGNITANTYDAFDRVLTTTAPEGNQVSYTYDARHNPLTVMLTPKPGSGLAPIVQTYTYDPTFNKVLTAKDGRGNTTTNVYNTTTGTLSSTTQPADAAGHQPVWQYGYGTSGASLGRLTSATDPLGVVTNYFYDSSSNLTSVVKDPGTAPHLNLTTSYTYDAVGNKLTVTDPRGGSTTVTSSYDALRRVTGTKAPTVAGVTLLTKPAYDADSRVTSVTSGNTLDGSTFSGTTIVSGATYSHSGQKATATDPNGNVTTTTYDLLDRVATVTAPIDASHNSVVSYSYDARGSLAQSVNTAVTPNVTLAQYAYRANGPALSFTDARGNALGYTYDGFDRLMTLTYPGGATEGTSYDANGNVLSRTTRKGDSIGFAYDNLNRVTSKTSPAGNVNYSYDLAGRPLTVTDPSTTDAIAIVVTPVSPGVRYTTNYSYDALSRPCAVNWNGNALSCPTTGPTITSPTIQETLTYNKANQRLRQTVSDISLLNEPTGAVGSTVTTTYGTANNLNQYPTVNSATLTYDSNGNLTFDGTNTFTYDAENRLLTASNSLHSASYTYDSLGRRRSKTVDGATTVYVSAGDQEVLEYAGNTATGQTAGQLVRHFVYGDGIDEPLDMMTPSTVASPANDTHRYTVPDPGGSVLALVDPTQTGSAALVSQYGYRPFGESTDSTGAYRFTSRRLDAETGLYYYRARMYSPALGRFLQPDPIGIKGGTNLYAYVGNDPLNRRDPSGLCFEDACVVEGAAAGTAYGVLYALVAAGVCVEACQPILNSIGRAASGIWNHIVNNEQANQPASPPANNGTQPAPAPTLPPGVGPGPYAGPSVPAGPSPRPTAGQQEDINAAGEQGGCHTCGTTDPGTQSGNWIGDHQPPTALNPPGNPQVYLPQCQGCSNTQGGLVRGLTNKFEALK